jgi:hypothetical protein
MFPVCILMRALSSSRYRIEQWDGIGPGYFMYFIWVGINPPLMAGHSGLASIKNFLYYDLVSETAYPATLALLAPHSLR